MRQKLGAIISRHISRRATLGRSSLSEFVPMALGPPVPSMEVVERGVKAAFGCRKRRVRRDPLSNNQRATTSKQLILLIVSHQCASRGHTADAHHSSEA